VVIVFFHHYQKIDEVWSLDEVGGLDEVRVLDEVWSLDDLDYLDHGGGDSDDIGGYCPTNEILYFHVH